MKKIYACLIGEWIDITSTGTVEDLKDPITFFEEMLVYPKGSKVAKAFEYDYINVQYQGKNYRIHPSLVQIVAE